MENNVIKSITAHVCPHCKADIYVESSMTPPSVNSVFTPEEAGAAKEDCLARVATLSISEEKKESIIRWVNSPETVFGPNEVETIILSALKPE